MRPIFTSPNDAQTQVIQSMLRQHGIETSLIEKKDVHQSYNLPKVVWKELWLRDEMDMQSAATAITQFQFNTFRNDLRIATTSESDSSDQSTPKKLPIEINVGLRTIPEQYEVEKKETSMPVNNKRVFNYLAELLGMADQEDAAEETEIDNVLRPWDSKSLMKTVDSLKQICS